MSKYGLRIIAPPEPADPSVAGMYQFALVNERTGKNDWSTQQRHRDKGKATYAAIHWAVRQLADAKKLAFVIGSGADDTVATLYGLPLRLRAPGAGAPRLPKASRRVPLNARVKPSTMEVLQSRTSSKKSLGEVIDEAVDASVDSANRE